METICITKVQAAQIAEFKEALRSGTAQFAFVGSIGAGIRFLQSNMRS